MIGLNVLCRICHAACTSVEGASWKIHLKLDPGVFPLHPVTRAWELRGFTWVPDFASTAFMIQGATLKAGLADCGDITDAVGN